MNAKYLVVGGGIAGVTCIETLAILHPEAPTVLMTASSLVKNVSNLRFYGKTIVQFDINKSEASLLQNIHPNLKILYDSLAHVNTKCKIATSVGGIQVKYDLICICTGGVPKLISQASKSQRILGIRDTESVKEFQEKLKTGKTMLIVGNGGIASEIVHTTRSINIVWVVRDDYISATFVDPGAAEFFQKGLNEKNPTEKKNSTLLRRHAYSQEDVMPLNENIKSAALGPEWITKLENIHKTGNTEDLEIIYQAEVTNILELDNKEYHLQVELSNGRKIFCDFVVSATGVQPAINFTWDVEPEIGPDGGLLVNEMQETTVKNVFAAGDVAYAGWKHAPHWFQLRLWTQARQMAGMAAKAMYATTNNEDAMQDFCFELFTHATTLFGYKVILLGKYNGQGLGNDYEILLRVTKGLEYVKFVLQNGRLQGAILIGETDLEEMCENLILDQIDLTPFGDDILNPDIDIDDYFD